MLWVSERQAEGLLLSLSVKRTLFAGRSQYQDILLVETHRYGKVLFLDGAVQLSEADEFFYHEALVHVPLFAHPAPRDVLIIGGGDGGAVREVLKHPGIRSLTLVEIDPLVTRLAQEHLGARFDHPVLRLLHADGIRHVAQAPSESLDVILVDSTDPVGPAQGLFSEEFFGHCARCLRPQGFLAMQSGSPILQLPLIKDVQAALRRGFSGRAWLYLAPVPTYPGGLWSFSIASMVLQPSQALRDAPRGMALRHWSPQVHQGSFALPRFLQDALKSL